MKLVADIVCGLKDQSMLKIELEDGIAAELSEYFSFYVPGYKFMPAFRRRIWDGKIKLFNTTSGELPVGLYPYLRNFSSKRN